jgi:tripartite-type tricarboxylate transporter receptor subunit TctC
MKSPARIVMVRVVAAAALAATATAASAQSYPTQPIRMIVPFTAGSPNDVVARLLAQQLTTRLGQSVIIDNRPGAGTNAGSKAAASAEPNGYTLIFNSSSMVVSPAMYKNPGYDPLKSFVPVANAVFGHWVTVIEKSIPANTVPEFIAYAKKNPGKINYGSAGPGTPQNIACELFKMMAGVDLVHVPYRGGAPAATDLVAGHLQVIFAPVSESIQHIKAGALRPLAVTTAARLDVLPDVPTVADFVPGYEASGFAGIGAPKNTPAEIIDMLNKELNAGLADSKVKTRIVELGGTVLGGTPAEFATILSEATEKWARVIKFAGIKAE